MHLSPIFSVISRLTKYAYLLGTMTRDEAVSKIGAAAAAVMVEAVANGGSGAGAAEIGSVDAEESEKTEAPNAARHAKVSRMASGDRVEDQVAGARIAFGKQGRE